MTKKTDYARRLVEARRQRKLTQTELGELSGVAQALISRYESGALTPNKNAQLLANALGASSCDLAEFEPPPPPTTPISERYSPSDLQIVERYQKLRRADLGRMHPGEKRPNTYTLKAWRRSAWVKAAIERGVLPPSAELGGELGHPPEPAPS